MEGICELGSNVKKFCWKHRTKIGLGALAIAGGVALYYYLQENETTPGQAGDPGNSEIGSDGKKSNGDEVISHEERKVSLESSQSDELKGDCEEDGRLRKAVNELYGFSVIYFLPNVRLRLKEIIDVSETIKRLKELKNDHSDESRDLKVSLWNQIKITSFTSLIATIYSMSAVSILLQVQMNILVRDTIKISNSGHCENNQEEDIFRALLEGSYTVFFGNGLERLVNYVKEVVILHVAEWTVESQLNVEYYDVIETIGTIRKDLEGDIAKLLNLLLLPAPSPAVCETEMSPAATPFPVATNSPTSIPSSTMLQSLIEQTFTIVTSPVFQAAYEETLQSTFHHVQELLRVSAFNASDSLVNSQGVTKNLPLASLLPKVKSITARLIPEDLPKNPLSLQQLKAITTGPQVSALCSRIFLSPQEFPATFPSPQVSGRLPDSPLPFPQKKGEADPLLPLKGVGDRQYKGAQSPKPNNQS